MFSPYEGQIVLAGFLTLDIPFGKGFVSSCVSLYELCF
jgi:hypothetical protein